MWQVVAETVQIMVENVKPGVLCSEVAWKVHEYQIKSGMQDFIYHRPGHGQGQNYEGHQPPCLALGDDTVIEEGMTFSVEPGLYDEKNGIGINPSRPAARAQGPLGPDEPRAVLEGVELPEDLSANRAARGRGRSSAGRPSGSAAGCRRRAR